jgi:hypothetical protein
LDGINTGINMNGFREGQTDTQTISGAPISRDAIVAALKEDGQLEGAVGTIGGGGQSISRPSIPPNTESTLTIKGKESGGEQSAGKNKGKGK